MSARTPPPTGPAQASRTGLHLASQKMLQKPQKVQLIFWGYYLYVTEESQTHGKESPLETHGHEPRWVDAGAVRGLLSIGKTKSYDVIAEIERRTSEEPDAVLRMGNLVRVKEDALMRWIRDRESRAAPSAPHRRPGPRRRCAGRGIGSDRTLAGTPRAHDATGARVAGVVAGGCHPRRLVALSGTGASARGRTRKPREERGPAYRRGL
jgi:hypothetical protein